MTVEDERRIEAARWYRHLCETSNAAFVPLYFDKSRYLVLCGGGGSGKSVFACRKVLERATTEAGHRFLVCRKVGRTLRESCFAQMRGMLADFYPEAGARINKTDQSIEFPNGSKIICSGLDDVEKLKSIYDITGIWIEEASELEEGDFNQLDIRLRTDFDGYLQMIITFNPISITHWLKKRFFDREDSRATTHRSTYKDNRFLTAEAIKTLEEFRETDEYYYQVYCLGQWGVTGKTIFNAKAVSERLLLIKPPEKIGQFAYDLEPDGVHISNIRWEDDEHGPVKIYESPKAGRPYVIGGDTAGDGSDFFIGQVLDNVTGKQVCTLRHQYDEDTYARQMYCLGKHYNDALLAVETNFSTYPVKLLELMGYKNLFVREVEDTFDGTIRHAFGFRTDRLTRPVIISELVRVMREHIALVNDQATLEEMLTFVRGDDLRPEAEPGAHDDTVMALAIAHYARPQQTMEVRAASKKSRWTRDMIEDFSRADEATRQQMLKQWGNPGG